MTPKPKGVGPPGPPPWLPLAAFAVAALGLLWAVLSHFIGQPEHVKPEHVKVEMHGNRNTGIGVIQGSHVSLGGSKSENSSPPEPAE